MKAGRKQNIVRILRGMSVFLFALCLLTGCAGAGTEQKQSEQKQDGKLQIGMSFDSFVIERWLRDRDLFELTAKNLGAEVNVQVANGDAQEQISQIRYFMKKNVDVIVVISVDGQDISEVIREARQEGIRVISYDRLVMDADTDLYISFDNGMVGTLMGEAMKEALPKGGNIFAIYGSPADHNVALVQQGFLAAIEDSGLNIVYSNYCDNWLSELAFDAVEEGLAQTPRNLAGVMCGNDDLAGQAFRALAENRLAGRVVLVGQDADLSACQRIVEGTQTMTVYKPVEQLAEKAAEFACALGYEKMLEEGRVSESQIPQTVKERMEELDGLPRISDSSALEDAGQIYVTTKEGSVSVIGAEGDSTGLTVVIDGTQTGDAGEEKRIGSPGVPYYAITPIAVTKENMDEVIIASDFHTAEDVYLNVKQ